MHHKIMITTFFLLLMLIGNANAQVGGSCSTCHVMHNSQGGGTLVHASTAGSAAGWNGSNQMGGGSDTTPQQYLAISNCVGCHTSSTSETIIDLGDGTRIPIVYNTSVPTKPLAGGNFYYVVNSGDSYGHNVRNISTADGTLSYGPGQMVGCASSCHTSLTLTDAATYVLMDGTHKNGCQGCHQSVKHHGLDTAGQPVDEDGGWYRFLSAPSGHIGYGGGVHGIEDPDWEQNPTSTDHNVYYGSDDGADLQEDPQSIGRFCAGCHYAFHSPGEAFSLVDNGGGSDPWVRHPANAVIPAAGEYTSYTTYDPLVPVGRPEKATLAAVAMDEVRPGTDRVICVSCHRAHGSPYPDMLRWDYINDCSAGVPNADCGCFICHSTKDD